MIKIIIHSEWSKLKPIKNEERYLERKSVCDTCPLKTGRWCDNDKFYDFKNNVSITRERLEMLNACMIKDCHDIAFINRMKFISGCGCDLFLKQISDSKCFRWNK